MIRSNKCFSSVFLVAVLFIATIEAQDSPSAANSELFTSDNKVDCVNKLVDWCDSMKFPKEGTAISMVSISVKDGSNVWRVFCASDSDSTNCTRNSSPWFSCTSNHTLTYKGVLLQKNKTDGVDDEMCNTTKTAFNDIFVQNLSYEPTNTTTNFDKGFEEFFREMAFLQEQIDFLRDRILEGFGCFPYCSKDSNRFPFSVEGGDSATELPSASGQGNQLERE